ncbi:hypothetical protein CMI47_03715 [Candidatus Pacearchaeota archaeon]|jgi:hypothetical protein|nr:hypothetical protein [Candidatus Pacearchaeota archaeon]|tara:strand:+ start:232 stop:447 length:216 start_codon:yes stop_codon:yes gene_type:complete
MDDYSKFMATLQALRAIDKAAFLRALGPQHAALEWSRFQAEPARWLAAVPLHMSRAVWAEVVQATTEPEPA